MDQWLAQVYGTGTQDTTVDLEKVAQAAILEKLAAEGGYDLSGLTEEQAVELANELMAQGGGEQPQQAQGQPQQQQAQGEPSDEEIEEQLAKEAQAKFEEADFLGRVMAHSYTQEMQKIAAKLPEGVEGPNKTFRGDVGRGARAVGGAISGAVHRGGELLAGGAKMMDPSHPGGATVRAGNTAILKNLAAGGAGQSEALKSMGARAGAAALLAGGAYGAKKLLSHKTEKTKEASIFEKLALDRAAEVLQANGIDPETGEPIQQEQQGQPQQGGQQMQGQQQEQQVDPDEQFQSAVDARAAEILAEHGYSME